jgi:undecaprenyl-diphosphatase
VPETPPADPTDAERPRRARTIRLVGFAGVAFAVVLLLRAWLEAVGPLPGERWSLRFTSWPPRPEPWRDIIAFFDLAGKPLFAIVTVGTAAWLVARSMGPRAAFFVVASSAAVAPNAILKVVLGPTPLWVESSSVAAANYPSGHVVYAVGLAGALAVLARERGRGDLVVLAAAMALIMGPTRVFGGSHLPSDVLAGYVFGAGWLALTTWLLRPAPGGVTAADARRGPGRPEAVPHPGATAHTGAAAGDPAGRG